MLFWQVKYLLIMYFFIVFHTITEPDSKFGYYFFSIITVSFANDKMDPKILVFNNLQFKESSSSKVKYLNWRLISVHKFEMY